MHLFPENVNEMTLSKIHHLNNHSERFKPKKEHGTCLFLEIKSKPLYMYEDDPIVSKDSYNQSIIGMEAV